MLAQPLATLTYGESPTLCVIRGSDPLFGTFLHQIPSVIAIRDKALREPDRARERNEVFNRRTQRVDVRLEYPRS